MDSQARSGLRIATTRVRSLAAIPAVIAEHGADPDAVIRRAGLDPKIFANFDAVIPFTALGRLVTESVKATGCEGFGLLVGARTRASGMGLAGLVSIHSPTVREGLEVITATLVTSDTGGATFLDVRRGVASLGYAVIAPNIESADQIVDGAIAIAFNLMRQLCGADWRAKRRPTHRANRPATGRRSPNSSRRRSCSAPRPPAIVFDADVLDDPVRDRDPHAADILAPLLREAAASAQGDFVSTARAVIRTQLAIGTLTRESVARALSLSARTLVHRLEARGLTYTGLADEAKYEAGAGDAQRRQADRRDRHAPWLRRPKRLHASVQDLVGRNAGPVAGGARVTDEATGALTN